jgi:eukaryotic-like serine/threonine-protein kinase
MVRRAARECHDVPALYTRLGEQITQASAREAFLGLITGSGPRTGAARAAGLTPAPAPTTGQATPAAAAPVSDALLEQAQKLLAVHVGPIAKVVVKRAAERTRQREALFALLAESVPEAARPRLLADLARLH